MRPIILLLFATFALPTLAAVPDERVAWLDRNAVPLETCEAGHGFEDMAPLVDMIACAQIVGLGESTHGTREHFQMKHRLVEYLVEEHGFSIFAIEASTPEAHRLDAYVLGGDGDPRELIAGMYFWTWDTEEVLAMVEWMRAYNATHDHKIHFTGFDMQTPDVAAEQVADFVLTLDPGRGQEIRERYASIVKATGGSAFGVVTYTFPLEEARGHTVRFKCRIKTEDVTDGYAGMWWRVDGPNRKTLAFDNMRDSGPRGTTDWTEYVVELPVAEEAENINFGFLLPGQGKAWFDDGSIELDGEEFDPKVFDLDFENERLVAGHYSNDDAYTASLDDQVAAGGAASLCLASRPKAVGTPAAQEAQIEAEAIQTELEGRRTEWLAERTEQEIERALFNARLVTQCMRMRARKIPGYRDLAMAENVVWLTEQHPDARIVLWAHNFHVSRQNGAMGKHLDEKFGPAYLPVGFATATGEYYAMSRSSSDKIHRLSPPPPASFEAVFASAKPSIFALDLRAAVKDSGSSGWILEGRPFRSIGAMAMDKQFHPQRISRLFDLMIFVETTTPARQLD
ncbi:MAG: erythromycin esterase family protein [bacterium]|nr:erythromycin esterase family protein [bacterium]